MLRALLLGFVLLLPASAQATVEFIVSPTATWATPGGVTTTQVECIAPGGNGYGGGGAGGGGAGGAYAKKTALAVSGTINLQVPGGAGSDCWFKTTGDVLAKAGGDSAGLSGGTSPAGNVGDTTFAGGAGGAQPGSGNAGAGGGGAGGPSGAGVAGSANSGGTCGSGGAGDNGSGGAGGASGSPTGKNGTEYDASHGSGGGGCGAGSGGSAPGGDGGLYGGGSGGDDNAGHGAGSPSAALIVLTYSVASSGTKRLLLLNVGDIEHPRVEFYSLNDLQAREWLWGPHANDNLRSVLTGTEN